MKKILVWLVMALTVLTLAGCGEERGSGDRQVYDIYLACDNGQDTVTFMYLKHFGDLLEQQSGGRIRAHYYPDAQVGGDVELLESIQNGNITFVTQNSAPEVNFVPQAALFDIPMAFPNEQVARQVLAAGTPVFNALQKAYAAKNIALLGISDQSFRQLTTNKPVSSLEDLKGLKIRTMENRYHLAFWRAVGSNPTPMTWSEVYIGLQQGVIDGQENPLESIVAARIYEQQKYTSITNHIYHTVMLVGSPKIINRLPADLQALIPKAAREATVWAGEQTDKRAAGRAKIISDGGSQIVPFNQQLFDQMKAQRGPVIDMIKARIGSELPDLLIEQVDKTVAADKAAAGAKP